MPWPAHSLVNHRPNQFGVTAVKSATVVKVSRYNIPFSTAHCDLFWAGMVFSINAVENGPNNFAAFQSLAKEINGTSTCSSSASSATETYYWARSSMIRRFEFVGFCGPRYFFCLGYFQFAADDMDLELLRTLFVVHYNCVHIPGAFGA